MTAFFLTENDRDDLREMLGEWQSRRLNAGVRSQRESLSQAPDVYVATIPPGGIPAATTTAGVTVTGVAECDIYRLSDLGLEQVQDLSKPVNNLGSALAPAAEWGIVSRDKFGDWLLVGGPAGVKSVGGASGIDVREIDDSPSFASTIVLAFDQGVFYLEQPSTGRVNVSPQNQSFSETVVAANAYGAGSWVITDYPYRNQPWWKVANVNSVDTVSWRGIAAPPGTSEGVEKVITNMGPGLQRVDHEAVDAPAAKRILLPSGLQRQIPDGASFRLRYDRTASRWRFVGPAAAGGAQEGLVVPGRQIFGAQPKQIPGVECHTYAFVGQISDSDAFLVPSFTGITINNGLDGHTDVLVMAGHSVGSSNVHPHRVSVTLRPQHGLATGSGNRAGILFAAVDEGGASNERPDLLVQTDGGGGVAWGFTGNNAFGDTFTSGLWTGGGTNNVVDGGVWT